MDIFLNLFVLALTLLITIIPITGDLWLTKDNKTKIFLRGRFFIGAAILALLVGVVQIIRSTNDQITRDSAQNKTLDNTEKIIGNVDTSTQKIKKTLLSIDSLNLKLDSLGIKTSTSIERRKDILNNFNSLNKQLEFIYKQQDLKLKENEPNVQILQEVKWVKVNDFYKIEIIFSNTGVRVAKSFDLGVIFFGTDKYGTILNSKYLSNDVVGEDDIPSKFGLKVHFPNQNSKNDTLPVGCILIYYTFSDFITDKIYYKTAKYWWRGIKLDGLEWFNYANRSLSDNIDKYIRNNNIQLITGQGKLFIQ
jgi:hypothetical protein